MDFAVLNAVGVIATAAWLVAARVAALDAGARRRSRTAWGIAVLLLGPSGWLLWGAVALADHARGRHGLLAGGARRPALLVVTLLLVAATVAALWLAAWPVPAAVYTPDDPELLPAGPTWQWECGSPAQAVARYSLDPQPLEGGSTRQEQALAHVRQACLQASGQRLVLAWELLAVPALALLWLAAETRSGPPRPSRDRRREVAAN